MNIIFKAASVFAVSLSLVACVANPAKKQSDTEQQTKEPSWVINPPDRAGHVYGVGSAEYYVDPANGLKLAKNKARVDLVSKMKVTISGSVNQEISETTRTGKETQLVKSVKQTVRSEVPTVALEEVKIEESWVNRGKKLAYAMAYLDRKKAEMRLKQKIAEIDLDLGQIAQIPMQGSTLEQLRKVLPALKILVKREDLAKQAQMVSMSGRKPMIDDSIRALEARIYDLLDKLVVSVKSNNNGADEIQSKIIESLTNSGIRISNNANSDIKISYAITLRDIEKSGTHYMFANGRVTLSDANGRVLSEFSHEAKGVSAYADLAKTKAIKNMAKLLGTELSTTLVDKIN